jgi:outer membrane protein TolC
MDLRQTFCCMMLVRLPRFFTQLTGAALLALWGSAAVRAQSSVLSLDDVVRIALANNRDVAAAAKEVDKSTDQIEAVRTNRLPQFSVRFIEPVIFTDLDLRLGPIGALPVPHTFAFVVGSAAQPITQLRDIAVGIKAAELTRDLANERLRAARQTVVDEIKRAYYGCLRAESGLKPARDAVELYREIERVVGAQVDERAALESDRLEVQARRAQQEHDVIVLENALATGRERLNVALARDPETPIEFQPIPASIPDEIDIDAARARLLDQRPEIRQARIAVDLARADARLKQLEQVPRVSALGGYVGNINFPLLPGNIAAAILQVSWEPFDWGRKSREYGIKELTVRQAELQLTQVEAGVTVELNAKARALRENRSLIGVTELAERAAREKVRVMLDRHEESAVLTKDLLQAQVALAAAIHDYQAALLGYWEARADFEKAAGGDQ